MMLSNDTLIPDGILCFGPSARSPTPRLAIATKFSEMSSLLPPLNVPQSPNQISERRLTTNYAFSKLEAVPEWDVASIRHAPHSLGAASVTGSTTRSRPVGRAEHCFITKSSSYAHKQVHWVNAVRADPLLKKQIVGALKSFQVVSHSDSTGGLPQTSWHRSCSLQFERCYQPHKS